jgi:hypothetical protein
MKSLASLKFIKVMVVFISSPWLSPLIKSLNSLIFSQYPGVLIHWGSWLGDLTSATRTLCPGGMFTLPDSHCRSMYHGSFLPWEENSRIDINSAQVHICGPRNWSTCSETLKGSLRRGHNFFLKFWTSELVRGAFTNPISPPPRGTSWEERGSGVFLLQTEEEVDSQCLHDIVLTTFEVAVGRGFWIRRKGGWRWKC